MKDLSILTVDGEQYEIVDKKGNIKYDEIIVLLTGVRDALKEDDPEKAIDLLDNFLLDKGGTLA